MSSHGYPVFGANGFVGFYPEYNHAEETIAIACIYWWRRREFAILASQRACMRIVVRGLAAVLLEFPTYPASVPDAVSFPVARTKRKKPTKIGELFSCVGGAAGIEGAGVHNKFMWLVKSETML